MYPQIPNSGELINQSLNAPNDSINTNANNINSNTKEYSTNLSNGDNISLSNGEWENRPYENYIKQLEKNYIDKSKEYNDAVMNDYSQFTAFFKPWSAAAYREKMQELKNQRDIIYGNLQNAKTERANYYSNLNAQKIKYKIEKESLKDAGITNPYFMLRNGSLPNNVNLTTNTKPNNYNPRYKNNNIPSTWDILKNLLNKKGNKKNNNSNSNELMELLPLIIGML